MPLSDSKLELYKSGEYCLEKNDGSMITIVNYRGRNFLMNSEGTFEIDTVDLHEDGAWDTRNMRCEPLSVIADRYKGKRTMNETVGIYYYDDRNIWDDGGARISLEDFVTEIFLNTSTPTRDLTEEEKDKYDRYSKNGLGLIWKDYPELAKFTDIDECWVVRLYQLDLLQTYLYGEEQKNRLLNALLKILETENGIEIVNDQLSNTFSAREISPMIPDSTGYICDTTILDHYLVCTFHDPARVNQELLKILFMYSEDGNRKLGQFKSKCKLLHGISILGIDLV